MPKSKEQFKHNLSKAKRQGKAEREEKAKRKEEDPVTTTLRNVFGGFNDVYSKNKLPW